VESEENRTIEGFGKKTHNQSLENTTSERGKRGKRRKACVAGDRKMQIPAVKILVIEDFIRAMCGGNYTEGFTNIFLNVKFQ